MPPIFSSQMAHTQKVHSMQIKTFLLPIMMATTVSMVACSSGDKDEKEMETQQAEAMPAKVEASMEMDAKDDMKSMEVEEKPKMEKAATSTDTPEYQLSYFIGYNVSSSIIASNPFTLDIDQTKQGILDGAQSKDSAVSQEQLQVADATIRARIEAKQAAEAADAESGETTEPMEETQESKLAATHLSYYIGYNLSSSVVASGSFDFDAQASISGLMDGNNGTESKVTPEQLEAADAQLRKRFEAKQQEAQKLAMEQAEAAKEDGIAYLKENSMKEGVITTDSGLQYSIITQGSTDGASPTPTDSVEVHYHGTLTDGTVFDSSVDRGQSISFPLNGVITGWTEGLQLMKVGDKFRFYIPSDLAYGARATGSIPAHSTLIFDVELLGINTQ